MNLQETKAVTFPLATMEDWEKKAEASLKGKSLAKLKTSTYEGIELKPLYTEDSSVINEEWPGFAPYTRGTDALGYAKRPWLVSQKIFGDSAEQILANFNQLVSRGQNSLAVDFSQLATMNSDELQFFLQEASKKEQPLFVDTKGGQKALLSQVKKLSKVEQEGLKGVLAEDPIAEGVIQGKGILDPEAFFAEWFEHLKEADLPNVKKILVKSTAVHNAGGNAVQELATALATASEYLHYGMKNGYTAEDVAKNIVFAFGIDSAFFMNVAKLRAARRLWSLLGQEFSTDPECFKMYIHAETSTFTSTLFDSYVNLLRQANQAFAAVIGGVQSLEVKEYSVASNETSSFSDRIARNIHLVIKEETLVDKVVDPAGGSFYVETLTNELTDKAWSLFLEIEKRGGLIEVLRTGWLQENVKETLTEKKENVAKRKDSLIGTNVYPNLEDTVVLNKSKSLEVALPYEIEQIIPLKGVRLAEDFENLRIASLNYKEKNGKCPEIGLICIKDLKSYKPRADFVKGFVAAGGVESIQQQCSTIDEVIQFVKTSSFKHYVLCGSDADYEEVAVAWTKAIVEADKQVEIFIAGKQNAELDQQLKTAGLKDVIAVGSNAVTQITSILTDLEVL
ncbi:MULTISPECIES: methylmalonyl-CoA mutase family protein [Bacillus]|uniref:methylmalonyl-CoA mutase family protein n=1 Tax=Bacillus TaxID=1386 RepID=UPI0002E1560F|nr:MULTISPECIES: methylmalonyl-CoA mutase family protein [Bacillus]